MDFLVMEMFFVHDFVKINQKNKLDLRCLFIFFQHNEVSHMCPAGVVVAP